MKIVITGALGMLGHALCERLGRGNEIFAWDRDELDITDAESVERRIVAVRPDVVVNAAAYTDVDRAESDEERAQRVNGDAVGFLARACAEVHAAFVHYSTDYVFDGENPSGYREDDEPTVAVNAYGRSKRRGEKELERYEHGQLHWYLVRTSWLFGPFGKNFVDTILERGKEGGELRVVNDQHGKPTYTVDLADATAELLTKRYVPGIYHVTNETGPLGITWFAFAEAIIEIAGLPASVIAVSSDEYPRPAKRPRFSMLLNTKLPPRRGWREALEAYLRSYG
jgi:dTDP-4-dehydrorhamnose reductase